jgi:hypothetical protein
VSTSELSHPIMVVAVRCFYRSGAWSRGSRVQPPHQAVSMLLTDAELQLQLRGMRPVSVECRSCPAMPRADGNDNMAVMTFAVEPGSLNRSLRSWFQWQHARWCWSNEPPRGIEAAPSTLPAR